MKNKTLSIIIPNYNKSSFIGVLIESILKQTRLPDEIIVVDDCSTDDSRNILTELARQNSLIKLFFLEENRGVQFARNFGASKSTCEYITFIDSDDFYYDPKKLENEMKHVGKNKLVCSRFYFYNSSDGTFTKPDYDTNSHRHYLRHQKYYLINLKYVPFYPYAYIIPKRVFLDIGGYNFKYNLFEDIDILIRLRLKGLKFIYLKSYGRAYRTNDDSTEHLSYVNREKVQLAVDEIKKLYLSKIKLESLYIRIRRKFILFFRKENKIGDKNV